MLSDFGFTKDREHGGIVVQLGAEASEMAPGIAFAHALGGQKGNAAVEDGFAEVGCGMRHDRARCVSNGMFFSNLICIWRDGA